jgi:hypothetical protein
MFEVAVRCGFVAADRRCSNSYTSVASTPGNVPGGSTCPEFLTLPAYLRHLAPTG